MRHRDIIRDYLSEKRPLTVGSIAGKESLSAPPEGCDAIELRLNSLGVGADIRQFAAKSPLPLLVTARGPAEGGQSPWSLEERAAAYLAMIPHAALIDIELRDFDLLVEVIMEARDADVIVVGSFHDFDQTPPIKELVGKIDSRADIHKFALMAKSGRDIAKHLGLMEEFAETPLSVMGMGPLGAAARPLMAKAGSLLNYGFLGTTPTAPNQWPAALLRQTLEI